jgi:hypothetical protein
MGWVSFFIGFLTGVLVCSLSVSFLNLGRIALYVREVEKSALVMLATVAESIAFIQTIKYRTMKEMGIPEHTIRATKNMDDYNFDAWKNSAVSNLLAAYPERLKSMARYVDWKTAMKLLNEVYKKGHKE